MNYDNSSLGEEWEREIRETWGSNILRANETASSVLAQSDIYVQGLVD